MNVITAIKNNWGRIFFLLLAVLILCTGCNGLITNQASSGAYLEYIGNPDNGLIQKKEIDDIEYEVRYLSPEAMALAELKDLTPSRQELNKVIEEYGHMAYFRVSIEAKGGHLFNAIQAMGENPDDLEAYLNFDAEQDFTIRVGGDTVKCGLYHFNRTYGLSKGWQIMLAFDLQKWNKESDWTLSYNDKLTQSGQLNFRFNSADIANIPKLIY